MQAERIGAPGPRPRMQLVGADGNAFAIIGRAKRAARAAGWTTSMVSRLQDEMRAGDYDHLLAVAMREFDDVGTRSEDEDEDERLDDEPFDEDDDFLEDEDDFDYNDDAWDPDDEDL